MTHQSLLFLFAFSSPLFFRFSCLMFFFWWALSFILVGEVLGKAIRVLGLDERKGRSIVEQDFHGNFWVNGTCFPFSLASLTERIVVSGML